MSTNKMLIDATHPEETRVVVLRGGRVEEFDYESAARKLLRGNIYLAKVTRVEPSLQAAFVEYGGNRHGFLAFNEIHPDYYQIPVADRQALIDEEAQAEAEEEAEVDAHAEQSAGHESPTLTVSDAGDDGSHDERPAREATAIIEERISEMPRPEVVSGHDQEDDGSGPRGHRHHGDAGESNGDDAGASESEASNGNGAEAVEQVSTEEDVMEEVPSRPRRRMRSYKIQEVIKRRQVILIQVVKEERGSKGAALTTYLSLAGRYTVLMPNTGRGGGISRKITNPQDRRRLKAIAHELEVPEGMGLIIRTAGAARTKQEIKRDFEYLLRLWESVRELTLQSTAPSLVYEEGNLIKRSIRDHYTKDVEEVIVAGDHAYQEAHDFMRMLMPAHAKNVIEYKDPEPLFNRFQIERQLNAMFSPFVTLRSGGYLVINQTEALVAIDINSGKSTRKFSIEETAVNTNLEAAEEIARQLKLRDLAGLIVIDFIDMEEKRNNRSVERRLKDSLRFDRARIQVGRISHFGLLEMSRQRLRTGVLEGSTSQCPHCQGTGIVRSTESLCLAVLRGIEDALTSNPRGGLIASTTAAVALYILNNKRAFINDMEKRYGVSIAVLASDKLQGANFSIERTAAPAQPLRRAERTAVSMDWGFDGEDADAEAVEAEVVAQEADSEPRDDDEAGAETSEGDQDGNRRGRRRRRRRGRRGDRPEGETLRGDATAHGDEAPEMNGEDHGEHGHAHVIEVDAADDEPETIGAGGEREEGEEEIENGNGDRGARRGRRRGRRGGQRGREREEGGEPAVLGADLPAARTSPVEEPVQIAGHGPQPDVAAFTVATMPTNVAMPGAEQPAAEFEGRHVGGGGGGSARRQRGGDWRRPDRDRNSDRPQRGRDRDRGGDRGGDRRRDRFEPSPEQSPVMSAAAIAAAIAAAAAEPPPPPPQPIEPPRAVEVEAMPPPRVVSESAPAVVSAPVVAPVQQEAATTAAPARPRRSMEPVASEPKLERVLVRPDQADGTGSDAPAAPARKGWWQRKLGAT